MPSFRTARRVRHSAAQMFDLVADVESYPQFLPLCQGLRVLRRQTDEAGKQVIVAEMQVGYKAIRESFTSRVTLDEARREILVEYVDGPFSRLENRWSFTDEPASAGGTPASRVEFFINYEFRSRTLGLLMGSMFDTAFRKFAEAFERRAHVVYGAPGSPRVPADA
jgi:coenzyme Q-binding protein COQ10